MRPFLIHMLILGVLALVGLWALIEEATAPETYGGLFSKYDFSTAYWFVFAGYALGSTIIVSIVALIQRLRTKRLSKVAVVLSHVVPVGLVWVFFSLGIHDYVGDVLKKRDLERQQARPEPAARGGPPPSPAPSIKKPAIQPSSGPIDPVEQGGSE